MRTPYETIKDELFLKELVDSLAMSGIANEIAGSSAPTSGSEHLISPCIGQNIRSSAASWYPGWHCNLYHEQSAGSPLCAGGDRTP